ncbi:hypothetical protein IWQ60_010178 [Tieghemiomyces parasiticus]|uniref:AN1-type domain-containing protein n=1 Tax=Tieghemiomyces parasiticus TaxID=78921 RepID=A0A9W8DIS9_9FUNG|nr:hypothetical protein IWQ60_010178 [Tieghemiomyces parasiticus]
MALLDVGRQCALPECRQLDFLPFRCQFCHEDYCESHWKVTGHDCPQKEQVKDVRVPVCPLCQKPVPVRRGDDPNLRVEQHIANNCADPGTSVSAPAYRSACYYPACKAKVLVATRCAKCQEQFCLKHRFETDHKCPGPVPVTRRFADRFQKRVTGNDKSSAQVTATKSATPSGSTQRVGSTNVAALSSPRPQGPEVIDLEALEDKRPVVIVID